MNKIGVVFKEKKNFCWFTKLKFMMRFIAIDAGAGDDDCAEMNAIKNNNEQV